jgi:flagellum-specific ATP synthase
VTLGTAALEAAVQRARDAIAPRVAGRVHGITGNVVEATLPDASIGELVTIERAGAEPLVGEVVGLRARAALVLLIDEPVGVRAGALAWRTSRTQQIPVSDALVGRIVDVFGRPIDGGPPLPPAATVPIDAPAPPLAARAAIATPFETGVRAIDALLTFGRGQRVGLFAGAGVGKTVLLRQIVEQSGADVTVMGLIGERGCEVHDIAALPSAARSVVVAATSDRSPLERARGALAATAIAEHFAARGRNVLLVIDSLTRYAMALREIGLSIGEPPATKGYPPSVFAALPRLLERVAPLRSGGSITGVYTVLVEGDDLSDPVADSARSLLDGHVVLSRELAARGHFPAIDVLASTSRVARQVTPRRQQEVADQTRRLLAMRREADELRSLGAYTPGSSPAYDDALERGRAWDRWAAQRSDERSDMRRALAELEAIVTRRDR